MSENRDYVKSPQRWPRRGPIPLPSSPFCLELLEPLLGSVSLRVGMKSLKAISFPLPNGQLLSKSQSPVGRSAGHLRDDYHEIACGILAAGAECLIRCLRRADTATRRRRVPLSTEELF